MSAAELNPADVKVDVVLQPLGGFAPVNTSGVRLTHLPTGIVVEETAARSAHANRHAAWERLAKEVAAAPSPPDRHALQAQGRHPAPCARFCEATAFGIEAKNLQHELRGAIESLLLERNERRVAEAQVEQLLAALQSMLDEDDGGRAAEQARQAIADVVKNRTIGRAAVSENPVKAAQDRRDNRMAP